MTVDNLHPNTLTKQRERLLEALRIRPATTLELRKDLDIMSPASRVHDLRHDFNINIKTEWSYGRGTLFEHRQARYALLVGEWTAAKKKRRKSKRIAKRVCNG